MEFADLSALVREEAAEVINNVISNGFKAMCDFLLSNGWDPDAIAVRLRP